MPRLRLFELDELRLLELDDLERATVELRVTDLVPRLILEPEADRLFLNPFIRLPMPDAALSENIDDLRESFCLKKLPKVLLLAVVLLFTFTLRFGIVYVLLVFKEPVLTLRAAELLKLAPFPLDRVLPLPVLPPELRDLPTDEPEPLLLLPPELVRPFPTEEPLDLLPLFTVPDELRPTDRPLPLTLVLFPVLLFLTEPVFTPRVLTPVRFPFKLDRVLASLRLTSPLLLGPLR